MNILITGGASGLGRSITTNLASHLPDSTVFFTYNKSKEAASALENQYPNVRSIKCDFSDTNELDALLKRMEIDHIDILINNAIVSFTKNYFHKIEADEFLDGFKKNILPSLLITQQFIKRARKNKFGKIITILSSAINDPLIGWSRYTAEKMYLLAMHKSWAKENIQFNITSNCVSPDFMKTDLQQDIDERILEEMISKHPLKRLLTTDEVAEIIYFLISATQHINGENIIIDPK
jgi:NAD(P)-dependent dehydrogenase (short-subunit alcohol dehydrogenase family)